MAKNKRGNGEGTIYRRTDGRWSTQYTAYTGKRKTLYSRTRQRVAARLAKGPSDREGGLSFDRENLRLAEYLRHWLMDSVRDSVRAATYDGYDRQVRNYISPALGRIKLTALTPAHVRALYREKLDSGLSPRTVQYVHVTLRKALKQADDGLVPRNASRRP